MGLLTILVLFKNYLSILFLLKSKMVHSSMAKFGQLFPVHIKQCRICGVHNIETFWTQEAARSIKQSSDVNSNWHSFPKSNTQVFFRQERGILHYFQ